jgi:hypothetical protein
MYELLMDGEKVASGDCTEDSAMSLFLRWSMHEHDKHFELRKDGVKFTETKRNFTQPIMHVFGPTRLDQEPKG